RLWQRLALLHRHDARDPVGALAQQLCCLAHDLGAIEGRFGTPHPEAVLDSRECRIKIRLRSMRDLANPLTSSRIDDLDASALGAGAPLAIDEELCIGIAVFGHIF